MAQRGAMSLTEIAVAVGIVAVISTISYLNFNTDRHKADLVLNKEREVASALLRMKADVSCYPAKLSGLTIPADAQDNACGGTNDISKWRGPYLSSARYHPDGSLDISDIVPNATLSLINVGTSWALKTGELPSSLIHQILAKCPKSDTCLEVTSMPGAPNVVMGLPADNEIMSTRQHALVFDGQLGLGAAMGTIVVNNQTAVASISPIGVFAPVSAIVGGTTYASANVATVATGSVATPTVPSGTPLPAPAAASAPASPASAPVAGIKTIAVQGLNMNAGPDTAHPYLGGIIAATPTGLYCSQEDTSNVVSVCGAAANSIVASDSAAIQAAFAPAFTQLYSDMVAVTFPPGNFWTWSTTITSTTGKTITLQLTSLLVNAWTPYYTVDVNIFYN